MSRICYKVKGTMTLIVKRGVLFVGRRKAIENAIDSHIFFSLSISLYPDS